MTFELLKEIDSGGGSALGEYMFLYGLIFMLKPKKIIEIGTARGGSAIAMAMALRDDDINGSIISFDIDSHAQDIARKQIAELGLSKYVVLIKGDSSLVRKHGVFDLAFINGDHTYEGCRKDYGNIVDRATYIVFHDAALGDVPAFLDDLRENDGQAIVSLVPFMGGKQWFKGEIVFRSISGVAIMRGKHSWKRGR